MLINEIDMLIQQETMRNLSNTMESLKEFETERDDERNSNELEIIYFKWILYFLKTLIPKELLIEFPEIKNSSNDIFLDIMDYFGVSKDEVYFIIELYEKNKHKDLFKCRSKRNPTLDEMYIRSQQEYDILCSVNDQQNQEKREIIKKLMKYVLCKK